MKSFKTIITICCILFKGIGILLQQCNAMFEKWLLEKDDRVTGLLTMRVTLGLRMLLFLMKLPMAIDVDMKLQTALIDIYTYSFTQMASNIRIGCGMPFDSA